MEFLPEGTPARVLTVEPVGLLDWRAPAGGVGLGQFVIAPLGPRRVFGCVWGRGTGEVAPEKLRAIAEVLDLPPLQPAMRAFLDRVADYTLTPMPHLLRMATRAPDLAAPPAARRVLSRGVAARMTDARRRVWEALPDGAALAPGALAAAAGVSSAVLRGMVAAGALVEALAPVPRFPTLDPHLPGPRLSPAQAAAVEVLREGDGYATTLLRGVTGSGKTEVYLEAVAACLARGRQALVLLPEIALSAEFLARVEARFGARPAEWHSEVTGAERRRLWHAAAEGTVQLVVGARSALFLPFADLGLIVVDEEHDGAYKQEDGVWYSARDMAVLRGSLEEAGVVLVSATPSLETVVNAASGKYRRADLPERHGTAALPAMAAIDLRADPPPPGRWLSPPLVDAVTVRLARGEQALLFLNRRGYAPVTLCRACGAQVGCDDCDARMVEHRVLRRLQCHQCGATRPVPTACPTCGTEGAMTAVGPGVERLAEEAAALWPHARLRVLSSDLYGGAREIKAALAEIAAGAADIVIGTQLVAKGHNFPKLTLVGVVDADLGLQGADLRAAEKSFALIQQVAGRAGRAEAPGEALLQTFQPDHPVIRAILTGDHEAFLAAEAEARRQAGMPPFGRLAGVILSHPDLAVVSDSARGLAARAGPLAEVGAELWGPAPAPIARVRGRHRVRMLIRAPRQAPVQDAIRAWLAGVKLPSGLRLAVDVDPQSFL